MWCRINRVKKKPAVALHHSPEEYAEDLLTTWVGQSQVDSLPAQAGEVLLVRAGYRDLFVIGALL